MTPALSICIPTLNTFPFLRERFDSIFRQTFRDWELFVYDSYSDDGSWEFVQDLATRDQRVRLAQGPRQGPYPAWNECLRHATGQYVYIATSDDSIADDFFEKMVAALEQHPECELAHSPLIVVDSNGNRVADRTWPECTVFGDAVNDVLTIPHIRRAPFDGLLHLTGRHSVLSITQLLIRRALFSRIGQFPDRWGSISDFNWEMKAGLVADMVHVPATWATWRVHAQQSSASNRSGTIEHFNQVEEMIGDAVAECLMRLPAAVAASLTSHFLEETKDMRVYYHTLRRLGDDVARRRAFQLAQVFAGKMAVRREILGRIIGRAKWSDSAPMEIRSWLEKLGLQPIAPCSIPEGEHRTSLKG